MLYLRQPSSRFIFCEFCLGIALLIGTGVFSWIATTQIREAHIWVAHTFEVLTVLSRMERRIHDMEMIDRIPASAERQDAFSRFASQDIIDGKDILFMLTTDNSYQQEQVRLMSQLLIQDTNLSISSMHQIRSIVYMMRDKEQQLLTKRTERVSDEYRIAQWFLVAGKIIALGLLALSFSQHRQEVIRRRLAEATLQNANSNLERQVKEYKVKT